MLTLAEALRGAAMLLAESLGSTTARRDAELLLLHVTGLSRAGLLTYPERLLTDAEAQAYEAAIARRAMAEPLQYITGMQEFYGLPFHVTPAVLIPRPETELLVQAALESAGSRPVNAADVGTGSGILAITLARFLPSAAITATDVSPAALEVAKLNADWLGVAGRICFLKTDLLRGLGPSQRFDLIVSNPPYVAEGERLERQVAEYEPHTALFAGPDGLSVYRRLIPEAAERLNLNGTLCLEIGQGQQDGVSALCWAAALRVLEVRTDLQGIPRVVVARKVDRD
jgi:release factor glutamine methyltransferase